MTPPAANPHYRPDIDGLRAVAVTVVVLFHAGCSWLPGGFVGVDVFFVISGFLITSIIRREQEKGVFSLAGFYERRARRILPALFGILVFCLVAGPFIMRPWDLAELGRSMKYVVGSVSNLYFKRVSGDYFGGEAEMMPLLHTWSLGVEEQFYICIPLLLLLLGRGPSGGNRLRAVYILVTAASLVYSAWLVDRNRAQCFYLLPGRAWELALGGILALWPVGKLTPLLRQIIGSGGLLMIMGAVLFYSDLTSFPGAGALLPCAGAALVIAAGGGGLAGRLLSTRVFVGVGLISYSVYLWHWPLLTFLRHLALHGCDVPRWAPLAAAALSYAAGWASWRWLETPFRQPKRWGRRGITIFSLAGLTVLFACAMIVQKTNIFYQLLPPEALRLADYRKSKNPLGDDAFSDHSVAATPYLYGDQKATPRLAIWGDSHANALAGALHQYMLDRHQSFRFYGRSGTVPLPGAPMDTHYVRADAQRYTDEVLPLLLKDDSIRIVMLAARWAIYVEGNTGAWGPAEAGTNESAPLLPVDNAAPGSAPIRETFARLLHDVIRQLQRAGKTVALVYPIPEAARRVPQFLSDEFIHGRDPAAARIPADGVFFQRQQFILQTMDALPDSPQLIRIKPHEMLIRDGALVLMHEKDVLYRDADHLTLEGVQFILPLFDPVFKLLKP
jgi:peptidoglycan/LPS O-acetylase OafA/YrhL